jgi:uncharacterized membrane protein
VLFSVVLISGSFAARVAGWRFSFPFWHQTAVLTYFTFLHQAYTRYMNIENAQEQKDGQRVIIIVLALLR